MVNNDDIFKTLKNKEGLTIAQIHDMTSNITNVFEQLRIMLIKHNIYSNSDIIANLKLVTYNNTNYLFIGKKLDEYIVINLDNQDINPTFDKDYLYKYYHIPKDSTYFINRNKSLINDVLAFYYQHQDILSLENLIINYIVDISLFHIIIYYNIITSDIIIHINSLDQSSYEQIYLKKDFYLYNIYSSNKIVEEKDIVDKIKDIKIPYECIPFFIQKAKTKIKI